MYRDIYVWIERVALYTRKRFLVGRPICSSRMGTFENAMVHRSTLFFFLISGIVEERGGVETGLFSSVRSLEVPPKFLTTPQRRAQSSGDRAAGCVEEQGRVGRLEATDALLANSGGAGSALPAGTETDEKVEVELRWWTTKRGSGIFQR